MKQSQGSNKLKDLLITKPEDEKQAVKDILQSLARFILDYDIDVKFLSEMKLQKIVFMTIEELELPITRSWYIRGCMVHPGGTLSGSVRKNTLEKLVQNPKKLVVNSDIYSCFNDIRVEKIFFTKRNLFLRHLYSSMEPARFRNEYIPNNEIIITSEEMSRGIFDDISSVISENISKLYLGMQEDELFDGISSKFYDFLNFIEETSIETEGLFEEGAEITQNDMVFFKRLSDAYHNRVWMEPASIISIETVKGLSAEKVIKQREKYLPIAARNINESLNELKNISEKLNFTLSENNIEKAYMRSYERVGENLGKHLTEMWKIYAK
ncbi:MAG: hypothetical protein K8R25_00450 [Methanosarcinales archaeon]|nr:hypothetical protein [Methanosarcinales archaeon]